MQQVPAPLLSCEAVFTEAAYFLLEGGLGVDALFGLIERGVLRIDYDLRVHWPRLLTLMARYKRMDLAGACIVAMTEQHRKASASHWADPNAGKDVDPSVASIRCTSASNAEIASACTTKPRFIGKDVTGIALTACGAGTASSFP